MSVDVLARGTVMSRVVMMRRLVLLVLLALVLLLRFSIHRFQYLRQAGSRL